MLTDHQSTLSVTVTEGFDAEVAMALIDSWRAVIPIGDAEVYERKALDVLPQYIQFIGSASVWAVLAPAAGAFLARLGYLLADDVVGAVRARVKPSRNEVEQLAASLHAARQKLSSPAMVLIAINLPDDRWGTALELNAADEAGLARQLAIYIANIERISELLNQHCGRGDGPLGQGKIELRDDGLIEVSWISQRDFKRIHLVLDPKS